MAVAHLSFTLCLFLLIGFPTWISGRAIEESDSSALIEDSENGLEGVGAREKRSADSDSSKLGLKDASDGIDSVASPLRDMPTGSKRSEEEGSERHLEGSDERGNEGRRTKREPTKKKSGGGCCCGKK